MTLTPAVVRAYDERAPSADETETATVALGCFWGPDATFGAREGVVRTRVGYAGGTKVDPTYHALGDHTEALQVDYDPGVVSYTDLLAQAFRNHRPQSQSRKTQYQNVVFTASPEQRAALEAFLDARGLAADAIETRVEQLSQFHLAEAYHQKHDLRSRRRLVDAFEEAGYDDADLRESPAAAKLNGHAAGNDIPDSDLAAPERGTTRGR